MSPGFTISFSWPSRLDGGQYSWVRRLVFKNLFEEQSKRRLTLWGYLTD